MSKLIDRPPQDWFPRPGTPWPTPYFPVQPPAQQGAGPAELAQLLALGQPLIGPSSLPQPWPYDLNGSMNPGALLGGALGSSIGGFGRDQTGQLLGGIGSTVGATLGSAIPIPGVGTFVGATLGNVVGRGISQVFCFAPGTMVWMADGSSRPIEALRPGMATAGGTVGAAYAHPGAGQAVYRYGQVLVTGAHAVLEAGRWLRVRDSAFAKALPDVTLARVHNLTTSRHRIFIGEHCFADAAETDADLADLDESLAALAAA